MNRISSNLHKADLTPKLFGKATLSAPPGKKKAEHKEPEQNNQIAQMKRQLEDTRRGNAISTIYSKMMTGSRLTKDELEYLRVNSPENYEKAVRIEKEREQHEKELKNCKSKEDVEKLNQTKMNMFMNEAKAVSSNPNIPLAKKKEMLDFITMRMSAFMKDYADYKLTQEYQELPEKSDESAVQVEVLHGADEAADEISQSDSARAVDDVQVDEVGQAIDAGEPDAPDGDVRSTTDSPDMACVYDSQGKRGKAQRNNGGSSFSARV